jgi:hypothetical protein
VGAIRNRGLARGAELSDTDKQLRSRSAQIFVESGPRSAHREIVDIERTCKPVDRRATPGNSEVSAGATLYTGGRFEIEESR